MIKFFLVMLTCFAIFRTEADWGYPEIDDAVVLNPSNHDDFIKEFDEVLVYYFLPGCKYCVYMDKFFDKLALEYKEKDQKIPFATFNCNRHISYCNKHAIPSFPFVKFYIRGHPINYFGDRTREAIDSFIQGIMSSKPKKINQEEFKNVVTKVTRDKPILFFVGKENSKSFHIFDLTSKFHNELNFYHLESIDFNYLREFKVFEDSDLVEEKFKNGIFAFYNVNALFFKGIHSFDNLDLFIYNLKHPDLLELDLDFLDSVTSDPQQFMVLFVQTMKDEVIIEFERFAKDHKKGISFLIANQETYYPDIYNELKELLLIEDSDLPCVRIFETTFSLRNLTKYKFPGDLSYNYYQEFLRAFKSASLHGYLKVQETGKDDRKGNFKVINSYNFQENVYVSGQDSILLYHSDFEKHEPSKKMFELLSRISNKSHYQNLKYFLINADKNELKSFYNKSRPVILLFSKRNLMNPLIYQDEPEYKKVTKFIKSRKNVDAKDSFKGGFMDPDL